MRNARFTAVLCIFMLACNNREAEQPQRNNPAQEVKKIDGQPPVNKEPEAKPDRRNPVNAVAARLYNEYGDNEATADSKYLDKVVRIRGWIVKIEKENGRYFAGFTALADASPCIFCRIRPDAVKDFAGLDLKINKGVVPEFTVEGVCKGKKAFRRVSTGYAVTLDDCILISKQPGK